MREQPRSYFITIIIKEMNYCSSETSLKSMFTKSERLKLIQNLDYRKRKSYCLKCLICLVIDIQLFIYLIYETLMRHHFFIVSQYLSFDIRQCLRCLGISIYNLLIISSETSETLRH